MLTKYCQYLVIENFWSEEQREHEDSFWCVTNLINHNFQMKNSVDVIKGQYSINICLWSQTTECDTSANSIKKYILKTY